MPRTQKAAVVIVLDIGRSGSLSSDENANFLKKSRECASMIMQRKIFSSPNDEIGIILMGSKESNNTLYNGDIYKNISIAIPLREPSWDAVRTLETETYGTCIDADWIEAVIVALHYLKKEAETRKFYEKKIVLFTNNFKNGSSDNVPLIESDMEDLKAELIVIGPNLKDEIKTADMTDGMEMAEEIIEKVNGCIYDLEQAIPQLMSFQKKKVKPQAWNVCLDIGSKIQIPVTGYKKINDGQKPVWKLCLASDEEDTALPERDVRCLRQDQSVVEESDRIESFCFGSTLVPYSEYDKKQLGYKGDQKCLSLVKITKEVFVPRHQWMGNSGICFVARDNDENATVAFSAIVQALEQLQSVAIVRKVYNNGNRPRMGALFPCVKTKKEYLLYVELPFANDLRQCLVPQLSVGNLKEEQLSAIDSLIDKMDLSVPVQVDESEEGEDGTVDKEWGDLLKPHQILDPYLQHVRRCISQRALNPEIPLPNLAPDLLRIMVEPPYSIKEAASECLKEISTLFPNLASIASANRKGGGKRNIAEKDVAETKNVNEGENSSKRVKEEVNDNLSSDDVGMVTPLEDFKVAIEQKMVPFNQVCQQMQNVILNLVLSSFGKEDFEKSKESLKLLRSSIIDAKIDRAVTILSYNNWMKDLYIQLQEKFKMGFWCLVTQDKLGFITCEECLESTFTVVEVRNILGEDISIDQDDSGDEKMDVGDLLNDM